jgi:hypothetical protein
MNKKREEIKNKFGWFDGCEAGSCVHTLSADTPEKLTMAIDDWQAKCREEDEMIVTIQSLSVVYAGGKWVAFFVWKDWWEYEE